MNTVERIKNICKTRKIAISTLEKECGFSNGYIGQLRKGFIPDNRLVKIAEFLNLSTDYLMTGDEKKAPELGTSMEHIELIGMYENLTDEQKIAIKNMMASMIK